jgi:photosystem II stability/assembly factor-like uncharacterized protein
MPTVHAAMRDGLLTVDDATDDPSGRLALTDRRLSSLAATGDAVLVGTVESGLLRSGDGGASFERVGAAMPERVTALAASPHDPEVVWAGTEPSRVFRSSDGGRTWTARPGLTDLDSADEWSFPPRPHTHHVRWIEPHPAEAGRLYVGIEAGALVRTDDGGATWRDRPEGARRDNHTLTTHPDAPERVWTAAGDGYAESRDGGDTWAYPQSGLDHRYCWSLALDPADPETVVVSAASGARDAHSPPAETYLYRKAGDEPWERVSDGVPTGEGPLRAVLQRGAEAGELYAANDRGLYRSTDAGRSWAAVEVDWPERFVGRTARDLAVV